MARVDNTVRDNEESAARSTELEHDERDQDEEEENEGILVKKIL